MSGVLNPVNGPAQRVVVKRLIIKNFKSLRDFNIDLRKFNLVVGPNGSGKTNVIEAIMLFKAIYSPTAQYVNPFLRWWGYRNVVWNGEEELPITLGLGMRAWDYDAYFEVTVTGAGGRFEVLREVLEVRDVLRIEREGDTVKVVHDPSFIRRKLSGEMPPEIGTPKEVQSVRIDLSRPVNLPFDIYGWAATHVRESGVAVMKLSTPLVDEGEPIRLISPIVTRLGEVVDPARGVKVEERTMPLISEVMDFVKFNRAIVIRQLNFKEIRTPQPIRMEAFLSEDCSNLSNVFHTWMLQKGRMGRLRAVLESIFDEEIVPRAELTTDGRVYVKVLERGRELEPPQVADGIWKILAIVLAIESKPDLLVIDELENSLHPKAVEYVIEELRRVDCPVVVTTHSPAVVDCVEPEELILLSKDETGATIPSRVVGPENVKEWLSKHGLTVSEGWLYRWEDTRGR